VIYFLLGIPIYMLAASLPMFFNIGKLSDYSYYFLGFVLAGFGGILWVSLAKTLNPSEISLWGLKWDIMITLCYFIIPFMFVKQELSSSNILGIVFAITGIILLKV
jgi:uncharacterized membrane protein HdeD (DUF308 family)